MSFQVLFACIIKEPLTENDMAATHMNLNRGLEQWDGVPLPG